MNNVKLIEIITDYSFENVFGETVIFADKLGTEIITNISSLELSKIKRALIHYKGESYNNIYFNDGKYYAIVKITV